MAPDSQKSRTAVKPRQGNASDQCNVIDQVATGSEMALAILNFLLLAVDRSDQ